MFLSNTNSALDIVVYAKMSYEKIFEFTAVVQLLQKILGPKTLTITVLFFEPDSLFNQFVIKVWGEKEQKIPTGHWSREIS